MRKALLALLSTLVSACFRDEGLIDPQKGNEPLATFIGAGIDYDNSEKVESEAIVRKQNEMSDPQIALVWQFVGPKEFVRAPSAAQVDAKPPYAFRVDLFEPPSSEILDNPDVSIGQFWLYCDRNRNGTLDRLIHPEMEPLNARIDSLYRAYQDALGEVVALSEVRDEPVDYQETFYVAANGAVVQMLEGRPDTLWVPKTDLEVRQGPVSATQTRTRVLGNVDKWERFFLVRKRDNDYFAITRPAPGYVYAVDVPYKRRLFPLPGRLREFESRVSDAIRAYSRYVLEGQVILRGAMAAKYPDYPYNGDTVSGADFVLARTRGHFVLYIRDARALAQVRRGERTSSFVVRNLERLEVGYNLIACDDQYRCEVLRQGSPVRLHFGTSDAFFNPPQSAVQAPVTEVPAGTVALPAPADLPAAERARLSGEYEYLPLRPLRVAEREGSLWADIPEAGLLRLHPVDALRFLTARRDLQLQFVPDAEGRILKVFVVKGKERYVGVRDSAKDAGDLPRRLDSLLAPRTVEAARERLQALADLRYDHGGDTLRLELDGDRIKAVLPGHYPVAVDPVDSAAFVARDLALRITAASEGGCPGLRVEQPGRRTFAPALGCRGKTPAELFPGLPDTLPNPASSHGGSASDDFPTVDGKPRFRSAADSAFLRSGDGWVDTVATSPEGAGAAFVRGGDYVLLRVPALSGKAVSVTVTLIPERGAGKRRVFLRLRGGKDRESQADPLGGLAWVAFEDKPRTLTVGPFVPGADPYYVRVEQVATADRPVAFVLGGYVAATE